MADSKILVPFIQSWEGGFGKHPKDPGGATMKGITLATFMAVYGNSKTEQDLKNITDEEWHHIFKRYFWDRWQADKIPSQSVANLVVDWTFNSGKAGITKVQELLGVKADGVVGPVTLNAVTSSDSKELFKRIWERRKKFLESLKNFNVFRKGWMNRLNGIKYGELKCSDGKVIRFNEFQ